jgi:hypothetical protein
MQSRRQKKKKKKQQQERPQAQAKQGNASPSRRTEIGKAK